MSFETETKQELKQLSQKIDTILHYLHNNDGTGELGLVASFKKHEQKMNTFLTDYETKEAVRKDRLKLLSVIFGSLGTLTTLIVNYLIELFIKNKT